MLVKAQLCDTRFNLTFDLYSDLSACVRVRLDSVTPLLPPDVERSSLHPAVAQFLPEARPPGFHWHRHRESETFTPGAGIKLLLFTSYSVQTEHYSVKLSRS